MTTDSLYATYGVPVQEADLWQKKLHDQLRPHLVEAFRGVDELWPGCLDPQNVDLHISVERKYAWSLGTRMVHFYVQIRYPKRCMEYKHRNFKTRKDGTLNLKGIVKAAKEMYAEAQAARAVRMLEDLSVDINRRRQEEDLEGIDIPEGLTVVRNPQTGRYGIRCWQAMGDMPRENLALVLQLMMIRGE